MDDSDQRRGAAEMQQNVARRPYNHCRYAGNHGDVWKHVILLEVLRNLASRKPKSFHYVETHAGPGYARLGDNGDWRRGIGRFMQGAVMTPGHPYFDLVLPAMQENLLYKGSWVLAAEYLRNVGHPNFKLTLHEINADTLKMAASAIRKGQLSSWVQLQPKSGYDALNKLDCADFILIDPPYRSSDGTADDWEKVMAAVNKARTTSRNWMVWYPVFRRDEPDELIRTSGGTAFELTWAPDAPGWVMKGCGLLTDPETASLMQFQPGMLRTLADSLGGLATIRMLNGDSLESLTLNSGLSAPEAQPAEQISSAHHDLTGLRGDAEFLGNPIEFGERGVVLKEPQPSLMSR